MFGEVALINRKGRNAHCIAMKPTECGVLNYPDYNQVFKKMQDLEQKFKKSFFERVVLKDQNLWDQAKLLMSFFDKSKYIRGQTLFKKGEQCQKIWIVIEGQVVLWDNVYRPDKVHHEIDDHLRNVSRVRIDLLILRDGEIVGDEGLFEDQSKDRCQYNGSFDCETVVYECPKRAFKAACDQHPLIKQFMLNKVQQKKFLLDGVVKQTQSEKKHHILQGTSVQSSKSVLGPVNVIVKKSEVLANIQMAKLQSDFEEIGLSKLKTPKHRLQPKTSSSKQTLQDKEDLEILEKVTRTKIDDNDVVSNKTEQYTKLIGEDIFNNQKLDHKNSSIYGQPKRRQPNPTIDYLEEMASKSGGVPVSKIIKRIQGIDTGSQSELTDELYQNTLMQLKNRGSRTNLGYSTSDLPKSSILNEKNEQSELLLKSSRLFLPLPSEKQIYLSKKNKNFSLPVLKGFRSLSPNSTQRDFVIGADSSGIGSSIQSPSRTRVGFKVSAHSTTRNGEFGGKSGFGVNFYSVDPTSIAYGEAVAKNYTNSSQIESTDIASPAREKLAVSISNQQYFQRSAQGSGYNLLAQPETQGDPSSPTKESFQKKTKFHHKIKSMNFAGPTTTLFKRRTDHLVIDSSSGRLMEKVSTEGNRSPIKSEGPMKFVGPATPTHTQPASAIIQRSVAGSSRFIGKSSIAAAISSKHVAADSLRIHGSASLVSMPKLTSPKSTAEPKVLNFEAVAKTSNLTSSIRLHNSPLYQATS